MEAENNLATKFVWLRELPEGECFRKPNSYEIFIKTNKRIGINKDTRMYCCVGLSKGNIENMPNIKVTAVSGKFVVNSDSDCKNTEEKHTCENCRNSEGEPNPFDTCNSCHNGSEYEGTKLPIQENLAETIMFLRAKNEQLDFELAQCKEDNKIFPGYCMDCKNIRYATQYDNNTKKAHTFDYCKHWSKEDSNGNTIYAETVADGYCYMFEPKDDGADDDTGTWTNGVCDNCGYDWSKDAPTASVPEYCPKCGQKKKINSMS